jgi:uncharacterized protein
MNRRCSSLTRRHALALIGACACAGPTGATRAAQPDEAPSLDPEQTRRFRAWITLLIHAQLEQGPTPRWTQRDCAGLVRFAVAEALRDHTSAWRQAMGLTRHRLPAELELDDAHQAALRHAWRRADGSRGAYVGALELVQENTRLVGRQLAQALPGDLLLYDLGDEQHLMVWMGRYAAYHTGRHDDADNGLRAMRAGDLMAWNDTRWRPTSDNPNFTGVWRLRFLSNAA